MFYKKQLESIHSEIIKYEQEFYISRNEDLEEQLKTISLISDSLWDVFSKYEKTDYFYDEKKTESLFFKISSIFSKEKKNILQDQLKVDTIFNKLISVTKSCKDSNSIPVTQTISDKEMTLAHYNTTIEELKTNFQTKIELEYSKINLLQNQNNVFDNETSLSIHNKLVELKEKISENNWSYLSFNTESHSKLIDSFKWLFKVKEDFFNNENDLFTIEFKWFQYYNSLLEKQKLIIDQLIGRDNWNKTFMLYYLNSMLVSSANMDLPTNDNDLSELDQSLSQLENEQVKYIKQYWYSQQIDFTRAFDRIHSNLSVENLYNKRAGTRHRRLSLREIVKFDINLFTTFFPIILTTPDVASNIFKGQNQYFDIVMFDEASQLKLEDNLPSLLKGKQIVIAGDEHQMPPSNYFSKIFDGTIEDEDEFEDDMTRIQNDAINSLLDCESLLDFASELGFEKRHLDFHYRSRHPFLIDYSNYAFYNQRLKPLPNDFDYIPIKYINVNGTYSDNSNNSEAETILSIIDNNISRLPNGEYPTVGIATFNINQRNLILSKINDRRKFDRYKGFNDKVAELEENGFFVKNLENIQGDERDVIILSTTYGINKDGKFAQRFGSINHQKGYKLLNVIITRAKYKIYVCSSIPQEVFLNYKEHLLTEGSNNRRASLYAYLAYAKAVSEKDDEARIAVLDALAENSLQNSSIDNFNADLESPFEEEVYEALTEHFDEGCIIPQLQFAGFRIDLVYDTKKIGLPKIAIECDGATYHSSQEAYLHDRHRQKILENHGFVFHRIWSTNWWRNPKRETQKLVEFIKSVECRNPSSFEDKSKVGLSFTDDIFIADMKIGQDSVDLPKVLKEKVKAIEQKKNIQSELFKDYVELSSKVKVKYLNIDKDFTFRLIQGETVKSEKANGIQEIDINSPLGMALKGQSVGATVKIGNLDKYIKILEILN